MIFKPEDFYIHGSEEPMGPNVASQLANEAFKSWLKNDLEKSECQHVPIIDEGNGQIYCDACLKKLKPAGWNAFE